VGVFLNEQYINIINIGESNNKEKEVVSN